LPDDRTINPALGFNQALYDIGARAAEAGPRMSLDLQSVIVWGNIDRLVAEPTEARGMFSGNSGGPVGTFELQSLGMGGVLIETVQATTQTGSLGVGIKGESIVGLGRPTLFHLDIGGAGSKSILRENPNSGTVGPAIVYSAGMVFNSPGVRIFVPRGSFFVLQALDAGSSVGIDITWREIPDSVRG